MPTRVRRSGVRAPRRESLRDSKKNAGLVSGHGHQSGGRGRQLRSDNILYEKNARQDGQTARAMPPHGPPRGLKKLRGKPDVYQLTDDLPGWNMDGSSTDKLASGSWIKHWEEKSQLPRWRCAYKDCDKPGEHGGHVWIRGHSSRANGVWIVPICKSCNYCENLKRRQCVDGNHSEIRKGAVVVRTEYTGDMATAERRFAESADAYDDGDDEGYESEAYSEMDWDGYDDDEDDDETDDEFSRGNFYSSEWGSAKRPRGRQCGGGSASAKKPRGRQCSGCGADISNKPPNYHKCLKCFSGGSASAKKPRGRQCSGCGADISKAPPHHFACRACYS